MSGASLGRHGTNPARANRGDWNTQTLARSQVRRCVPKNELGNGVLFGESIAAFAMWVVICGSRRQVGDGQRRRLFTHSHAVSYQIPNALTYQPCETRPDPKVVLLPLQTIFYISIAFLYASIWPYTWISRA